MIFGRFHSWLRPGTKLPTIPAGRRVYAIGDIHGRLDLLQELLAGIQVHAEREAGLHNGLVFLGDYIDRGPNSKGVIDLLLELSWPGWDVIFLKGNHDQTFLEFLGDANVYRAWRNFGAPETLLSYGVRPPMFDNDAAFAKAHSALVDACPRSHIDFLERLENFHIEGDYVFVHAGIRPGIPLDRQRPDDLLWIRDDFLLSSRQFEKVVVHGHTPTEGPVRRKNRIGIDTGAHATGCLTAAVLMGEHCVFLGTGHSPDGSVGVMSERPQHHRKLGAF
jgi:serine/threonine protein phosphatase 1